MKTAKIFKSGNSQAVRLPKEFQFDASEVQVFKRGDEVVLKKNLAIWLAYLSCWLNFRMILWRMDGSSRMSRIGNHFDIHA